MIKNLLATGILVLIFLGGCDLFNVRESEPPDKPPLWNNFYTTWTLTLQNLEFSYEDHRNMVKYADLFTADYRFYFAVQDISDYNINIIWTKDRERDMLFNLYNWADSMGVELETLAEQPDEITSSEARLIRKYKLTVRHPNEKVTYEGKFDIRMRQENGFWRIFKWYDYHLGGTPPKPTWGKMKYDFSL